MTYKKTSKQQYAGHKPKASLAKIKTKHWGVVLYPKGTKPVVAEVKVGSSETIIKEGLGYKKPSDIDAIRKALEIKAKRELAQDQKAEVEIKFPQDHKAPVKFSVHGEQPLKPRIINYPSGWVPPEGILEDVRRELQNPKRKTASDVEVMAYLSSASLAMPLSEQWTRIFMYVTRNYFRSKGWKKFDGGMKFLEDAKTLREDDKRELEHLRNWVFEHQQKDLAERRKQVKKATK